MPGTGGCIGLKDGKERFSSVQSVYSEFHYQMFISFDINDYCILLTVPFVPFCVYVSPNGRHQVDESVFGHRDKFLPFSKEKPQVDEIDRTVRRKSDLKSMPRSECDSRGCSFRLYESLICYSCTCRVPCLERVRSVIRHHSFISSTLPDLVL